MSADIEDMADIERAIGRWQPPPRHVLVFVHDALSALASVCDGAASRDGVGYSKAHASAGCMLASLPSGPLQEKPTFLAAADLCFVYREQITNLLGSGADSGSWAWLERHITPASRFTGLPQGRFITAADPDSPIGTSCLLALRRCPAEISAVQFALLARAMGIAEAHDGLRIGFRRREHFPLLTGLLMAGAHEMIPEDLDRAREVLRSLKEAADAGKVSALCHPRQALKHPVVLYPDLRLNELPWAVSFAFDPELVEAIKSAGARWWPGSKVWYLPRRGSQSADEFARALVDIAGDRLVLCAPEAGQPSSTDPDVTTITYLAKTTDPKALVQTVDQAERFLSRCLARRVAADPSSGGGSGPGGKLVTDDEGLPAAELYIPFAMEALRDQVKTIGGRFDGDSKRWRIPVTAFSLDGIKSLSDVQWQRPLDEALADIKIPPFGYLDVGDDGFIHMNTPYHPDLVAFIRREIPRLDKSFDSETKTWSFRVATAELPARVLDLVREYRLAMRDADGRELTLPETERHLEELAQGIKSRMVESYDATSDYDVPGFLLPPFPFQRAGMGYVKKHGDSLIADDCGLGKTPQAIGALVDHDAFPALIACPSIARLTWEQELQKFVDCIPADEVTVLGVGTTKKQKARALERVPTSKVVIVNYDILFKHADLLSSTPFKGCVLDESHYVKNQGSQRTQAAIRVMANPSLKLRLLLSATPYVNRPSEMITQLGMIDKLDVIGGARYVKSLDDAGDKGLAEFNHRLRAVCMIRREKRQVWKEMPEVLVSTVPCLSSSDYRQAEGEWAEQIVLEALADIDCDTLGDLQRRAERDEHDIIPDICQSAGMGAIGVAPKVGFGEQSRLRQALGQAKVGAMLEWLKNFRDSTPADEKLVIFANHISVQKDLYQGALDLGLEAVRLAGDQDPAARKAEEQRFHEGSARVCVASMKAARENITLTAGSHVLFAELDWSGGVMIQCRDRLIRISQRNKVVNVYLGLMADSLDVSMAASVREKMEMITRGLGDANPQDGLSAESAQCATQDLLFRQWPIVKRAVRNFRAAA